MQKPSMRYGGGFFDLRSALFYLSAKLQRKKVELLKTSPKLCAQVLAASDKKGSFLEYLVATPAWHPIYSLESTDGTLWEELIQNFQTILSKISWKERFPEILKKKVQEEIERSPEIVDARFIANFALSTLYELIFFSPISLEDEALFYQASLEWRKEIAVKGKADKNTKEAFWKRLQEITDQSPFAEDLKTARADPGRFLSAIAQPFLISPQINVGDIMVAVFGFLRSEVGLLAKCQEAVAQDNTAFLSGVIMESIRLKHPFPILERELTSDLGWEGQTYQAGTQFFMFFDQFIQDTDFNPLRWSGPQSKNQYHAMPFGVGRRMCLGKPIALMLLTELLKLLVSHFSIDQIHPEAGHLYSGRHNDSGAGLGETFYQLRVFARVLWKSWRMGRG